MIYIEPEPVAESNFRLPARMGMEIPMLRTQVRQSALKKGVGFLADFGF
jgi:hypothetical protein